MKFILTDEELALDLARGRNVLDSLGLSLTHVIDNLASPILINDAEPIKLEPKVVEPKDNPLVSEDKSTTIIMPGSGRPVDTPNKHSTIKEKVALDINSGMSLELASKVHDVSMSQASNYANGMTTHGVVDQKLMPVVVASKSEIKDKAAAIVMLGLGLLENNINALKARELPGAIKSMSEVMEKMTPKTNQDGVGNVHYHFYAPKQREESQYEVVEVG